MESLAIHCCLGRHVHRVIHSPHGVSFSDCGGFKHELKNKSHRISKKFSDLTRNVNDARETSQHQRTLIEKLS